MMTILLTINIMLNLTFSFITHPLSMGMILLIQTSTIALITGQFCSTFWFSYILFLILVGGMLILFIYMTSIASNEKFSFNPKSIFIITIIPILVTLMKSFNLELFTKPMMINQFTQESHMPLSFNKYINFPTTLLLAFMIIYLLITLIAAVKICKFNEGPLRQMN